METKQDTGGGDVYRHTIKRSNSIFKVLFCVIKERTGAAGLTWLQRLVCRLFKITPENKYWYVVKVSVGPPGIARVSDFVVGVDGNKWRVCNIDTQGNLELRNIEPIMITGIQGGMAIISSAVSERTC